MFTRAILAAMAVVVVLAGQAEAELFPRLRRDIQRNRCWPAPFLAPDRLADPKHIGRRAFRAGHRHAE